MTSPQRFFTRVLLFMLLVILVVAAVYGIIARAFMHNPALNGLIVGVLLLGILYACRRILSLRAEVRWIEAFRTAGPGFSLEEPPRLLAPVAGVLGDQERRGQASLSAMSMRYLLDSISARLDESRDITRYQTGLLIFLGLLGTFWGLLETINAVGTVISDLQLSSDNISDGFDELKRGLAAPMTGMGTAFSSSLFGLAGLAHSRFHRSAGDPGAEHVLQRDGGMAVGPDPSAQRWPGVQRGKRKVGRFCRAICRR